MKKLIILTATFLTLVACSKRDDITVPSFTKGQEVTITAGMPANSTQSRIRSEVTTQINFFWEQSDAGKSVKVTVGGVDAEFKIQTVSADGTRATFSGSMPAAGTELTVQYPYDEPDLSTQQYEVNNLPKNKMLFRGTGTLGSTITMDPQYAALKLNLYHDAEGRSITSLDVTLTNDTGYNKTFSMQDTIPLDITEGAATPIFFVLPTGKFHIDVEGWVEDASSGVPGSLSTSGTKNLTAGQCLNMAPALFCLAEGTRITMADGSFKNVEDIVVGDMIRTFDHEAGRISSSKVCFTEEMDANTPLTLNFASGNRLKIVGQHCLLSEDTRKYLSLDLANVNDYIGKRFYNAKTQSWDRLTGYEKGKTPVKSYAIYSAYHLNVIAENMLTVEDDIYFLLNIYELDENLKADPDQLAADIEQYGLYDVAEVHPELAQYKEYIEQFGSRYYYIAKGKGLASQSLIDELTSYWSNL